MTTTRDALSRFLKAFRREIAAVAREGYASEGRGVVRVDLSAEGDHGATAAETMYHALEEIEEIAEELDGAARESTDALLRLIKTYDPTRQAVLTAALPGQAPISMKIQLDMTAEVSETRGVH